MIKCLECRYCKHHSIAIRWIHFFLIIVVIVISYGCMCTYVFLRFGNKVDRKSVV